PPYRLPVWAQAIGLVAVSQTALSLVVFFSGLSSTPAGVQPLPVPAWVYGVLAIVLTVCGLGLVTSNRHDARAAWLGALFTLMSAPLAMRLQRSATPWMDWVAVVRPEACLGLVFWMFLDAFPSSAAG